MAVAAKTDIAFEAVGAFGYGLPVSGERVLRVVLVRATVSNDKRKRHIETVSDASDHLLPLRRWPRWKSWVGLFQAAIWAHLAYTWAIKPEALE